MAVLLPCQCQEVGVCQKPLGLLGVPRPDLMAPAIQGDHSVRYLNVSHEV